MNEYEAVKDFSQFLFTIDNPVKEPLDILQEEPSSGEENNYLFPAPLDLGEGQEMQRVSLIDISATEDSITELSRAESRLTDERELIREFNQFSFTTPIPLYVPLNIVQEEPGPNLGAATVTEDSLSFAPLAPSNFQNLTADIGRGFGDPDNRYAWSVIEEDGFLFVGTLNVENGGEIWRTSLDETNWTKVFDFGTEVQGIRELVVYQDQLYAFTTGDIETEPSGFVSSDNGETWTEITGGPLDSPVNESIRTSIVHDGLLYVGTIDSSGAEIWTYDGANWTLEKKFSEDIETISEFIEFEDELYVGAWNNFGSYFFTGENFDVDVTPSFRRFFDVNNGGVLDTVEFQDQLYLSTWNFISGFSIFRTDDPLTGEWEIVTRNGFGDRDNAYGWNMAVYDDPLTPEEGDELYLGTFNSGFYDGNGVPFDGPGQLYSTPDGDTWELVDIPDLGQFTWGIRNVLVTSTNQLVLGTATNNILSQDDVPSGELGTQIWIADL
ncbi:MAG: hypothetical protein KTR27_09065 [Leptolyngbyaceae cyanobacterium MAG.088]|nr:hypothetical protein [Leptolyngbyaceae cyanobacterium MAG.088]